MVDWASITWADLSPEARRAAEVLIVDALGIASAGRTARFATGPAGLPAEGLATALTGIDNQEG